MSSFFTVPGSQKKRKRTAAPEPPKKRLAASKSAGKASSKPAGPTKKRVERDDESISGSDSDDDDESYDSASNEGDAVEEEDEEGQVHEFLLDPNELAKPSIKDTAVVRAPVWLFNLTAGRFLTKKTSDLEIEIPGDEDDSDVPQRTPSTDSAGEDFELLDKSTDSLSKAKASGAQQGGKANKRKGKKR
ncbi:hypothetical protein NM208_g9818 [Fusarium decemcellulare]|uniref:Uncharacterized protein n=1 Tax=Fusarium decemcellulare TaxID=57161 RepID=A0ACC1S048_9HYPO|nr:hypothetical protein NM208_g9818 [Fusarium decemcellulare]